MLDFDSIAPHLQIKIAEKIEFYDQIEFDASSKCAKNAMHFTNHRAVFELSELVGGVEDTDLLLNSELWKTCGQVCKIAHLPRFKISRIEFTSDDSLDSLKELCQRQCFVANEVHLDWRFFERSTCDLSQFSDVLLEFFNITSVVCYGTIVENIFFSQRFCEIPIIRLHSRYIPDECLLKLQSSQIELFDQLARVFQTTNLLFSEWFTKKRIIKWLHCRTIDQTVDRNKTEILFDGLPYSVLWEYKDKHPNSNFLKTPGHPLFKGFDMLKITSAYFIDRGDLKLLVIVGIWSQCEGIYAFECCNLEDLIWMPGNERNMIDFSSISRHLQMRIAEQIDYFDQKEFELSSKCGKETIISRTKEAVVEQIRITTSGNACTMYAKSLDNGEYRSWKCHNVRQFSQLPHFKVKELRFENDTPLDSFLNLCERQLFVPSEVVLSLEFMNCDVALFSVLSKFFNITRVFVEEHELINEELFSFANFCEVRDISLVPGETADENLLRLRSENISLKKQGDNQSSVTANLFLKQWFSGTRNIKCLRFWTEDDEHIDSFTQNILFSGIPYEIVWQYNGNRRMPHLLIPNSYDSGGRDGYYELNKEHILYWINRGDKKLFVRVGFDEELEYSLVAVECTQIEIDASTEFKIRVV